MRLDKAINLKIDSETLALIDAYAKAEDVGRSEAVRRLVKRALSQGELADVISERVEDRVAKVCSRGTKASLANFIATMTFASAIGNIERANHNVIMDALEQEGIRTPPQNVGAHLAELYQWEGLGPRELFEFFWNAGGQAQQGEGTPTYDASVKGLKKPLPDLPRLDVEEELERRCADWFDRNFGPGFYETWSGMVELRESRERLREEASRGEAYISPRQADDLAREDTAYRNALVDVTDAAEEERDPYFRRLVFDPDVPPFWREPTEGEKEERLEEEKELFRAFGFTNID